MKSNLLQPTATLFVALIAHSALAGELMIQDAWVMLPPPNSSAAAFMKIHNPTGEDILLIGAATSAARRVEIHRSVIEDGVARMKRMKTVAVPAGESVVLAPRGLHLMLFDPIPLSDVAEVEIELKFSDQSSRKVKAVVRRAAPEDQPTSHHHSHD